VRLPHLEKSPRDSLGKKRPAHFVAARLRTSRARDN
jgi:hypothetical protein